MFNFTESCQTMSFNFAKSFFESCQKYPNHPAIITKGKQLSYKELFFEVSKVYRFLVANKVQDSIIGIYAKTDLQNAIGLLAIAAYGSAYLPLNPKFAVKRNQYIVENSGLNCILVFEDVSHFGEKTLRMTDCIPERETMHLTPVVEQELAYVLYTSGSTGVPKGVPVSKENVEALFNFFLTNYNFSEKDRFIQTFDWTFDISVLAFFFPLMVGASISFLPKEGLKFLQILGILQKQEITAAFLVPSVAALSKKYLPEIVLPKLKYCFFAGEALSHDLMEIWQKSCPNCQIENHYGLTETAVYITRYVWHKTRSAKEAFNGIVPIGKLYPGTKMLILDKNNQSCKVGEIGELCLSGKQVITQYINNDFTERFFNKNRNGECLVFFRTGDLVKLNDSNEMLYIGRNDEQIQLQGHRVELKEIAFYLQKITERLCTVIAKKDVNGNLFLVAFVEQNEQTEKDILSVLAENINQYMLPKKIVFVKKMPLNQNEKIDKAALQKLNV